MTVFLRADPSLFKSEFESGSKNLTWAIPKAPIMTEKKTVSTTPIVYPLPGSMISTAPYQNARA